MTILVFSPNWLGDAVMSLPAVADLRRFAEGGTLLVAARPGIAELWAMVPGVDGIVTLRAASGPRSAALRAQVEAVKHAGADTAVLLPNSFHTALVAWRAGIPARCGYRRQSRGWLLTRPVPRRRGRVHQVDYYRHLAAATGAEYGPREPRLALVY